MMKKALFLTMFLGCSSAAVAHTKPYHTFYFGANTGASFVTNQSFDWYHTEPQDGPGYHFINREESSARGYNGGLMVGYNFYCDCNMMLGIEASANLYTNRGHYSTVFYNPHNETTGNWEFSHDMNYSFHLTAHPSFLINNCTILYFNAGLGYAKVNFRANNLAYGHSQDMEWEDDHVNGHHHTSWSDDENAYGFTLGAGIQKRITACVGVFAEYQYTHYGKVCLDDAPKAHSHGSAPSLPPLGVFSERDATIDTNVFKVGLVFTM